MLNQDPVTQNFGYPPMRFMRFEPSLYCSCCSWRSSCFAYCCCCPHSHCHRSHVQVSSASGPGQTLPHPLCSTGPSLGAQPPTELARLVPATDHFIPGESEKLYWLAVRAPALLYLGPGPLSVSVLQMGDQLAGAGAAEVLGPSERFPGTVAIHFRHPMSLAFVRVRRNPEWMEAVQSLEMGIRYGDPDAAYASDLVLAQPVISTPLLEFPSGREAYAFPPGASQRSFLEYVASAYEMLLDGLSFAEYEIAAELPLVTFPIAGQTPPTPLIAPPNFVGPTPPMNAEHNNNYCGISAFIHSMQRKFPGSLPPNVDGKSNPNDPTDWDKVGDDLDHSNTFGERGSKMVENINKNFRDKPGAANGKRYCAGELSDISVANLAAWAEDCDLKLLVYDLPTFGHWVDLTGITPTATGADLTIQDYSSSYTVSYNDRDGTIDFTNAAGSTMGNRGKRFGGKNPLEQFYFCVVCECDEKNGKQTLPKHTHSGKTLRGGRQRNRRVKYGLDD